jgi:hypothetical protein
VKVSKFVPFFAFGFLLMTGSLVLSATVKQTAYAGADSSCHFHGSQAALEATVLVCAGKQKEKLISKGKIDASWKSLAHEKIELVEGKKRKEWKITFKDPAAKDKEKEFLYMFYSLEGNFIAANFTGK